MCFKAKPIYISHMINMYSYTNLYSYTVNNNKMNACLKVAFDFAILSPFIYIFLYTIIDTEFLD